MGHKAPFVPHGNCANCKFSIPTNKNHWQHGFHSLVCKRFPPTGATDATEDGPWSHEAFVHDIDFCGEWKAE